MKKIIINIINALLSLLILPLLAILFIIILLAVPFLCLFGFAKVFYYDKETGDFSIIKAIIDEK